MMGNEVSNIDSGILKAESNWRSLASAAVLIIISPILAELLMGVVHLTNIWLLLPEMGVYGFAALIIRETARRCDRGWGTILLLGLAYAIAEECIILQTSLTPQFFPPAHAGNFGWAYGVQWIYLVALVWYESVYAIVLPIYLTEMLFPSRRNEQWIDQRGFNISVVVFVLSSIGVWWLWTHVGLLKFGESTYQVPFSHIGIAVVVIALIVGGTLFLGQGSKSERKGKRKAWAPWIIGIMAFVHGLIWFVLIALAYVPADKIPGANPVVPIVAGLVWVLAGLLIFRSLSHKQGWQDRHRLAVIFGLSLAGMIGGILVVIKASPVDRIGKLVFDVTAIVLFVYVGHQLKKRMKAISKEAAAD